MRLPLRAALRSLPRIVLALALGVACYLPFAAAGAGKNLEHTSAVSVFTVFIFFLVMSQLIEVIFHKMDHRFQHHNQKG